MTLDVVIPVYRNAALVEACLESVLRHADARLGRVFIVDDASPEEGVRSVIRRWQLEAPRVRLLRRAQNGGFVYAANLGIAASENDVVVLNSDTRVTHGWLAQLAHLLSTEPSVAAVSPLSDNGGMCSVPRPNEENELDDAQVARFQLQRLPAFTAMPTAPGFCLALRRRVLAQIGALDPHYAPGYHEENDWCQRARAAGWKVGRANRAFVFHVGRASFGAARSGLDQLNGWRLARRYPHFFEDARRFDASVEAGLAARAVVASLGRISSSDFQMVTHGNPPLSGGRPAVARVARADLSNARADEWLRGVQGAVGDASLLSELCARWPSLRVSEAPSSAFLTELALNPDMAALLRQGAEPGVPAQDGEASWQTKF